MFKDDHEINRERIEEHLKFGRRCWLFDSSVFIFFELLERATGVDMLRVLKDCDNDYYFVLGCAAIEVSNGMVDPLLRIGKFGDHLLAVGGGIGHGYGGRKRQKENRFLVEMENGEVGVFEGHKGLSTVDFQQIAFCQAHPALIFVSNDRKCLKTAAHLLSPRHTATLAGLMAGLTDSYPANKDLGRVKVYCDTISQRKVR